MISETDRIWPPVESEKASGNKPEAFLDTGGNCGLSHSLKSALRLPNHRDIARSEATWQSKDLRLFRTLKKRYTVDSHVASLLGMTEMLELLRRFISER